MSRNKSFPSNTEITSNSTKSFPFKNLVFLSIKNKSSDTIYYNIDGNGAVSLDPGEEDPFPCDSNCPMSGRIAFTYKEATNILIKIRTIEKA